MLEFLFLMFFSFCAVIVAAVILFLYIMQIKGLKREIEILQDRERSLVSERLELRAEVDKITKEKEDIEDKKSSCGFRKKEE